MTTHRYDEAITFVSWMKRALHIRRPRSQKGVAYCGLVVTRTALTVHEFTIEHPDEIPLEIRIERDFARLCSKCARAFTHEVTELHGELSAAPVIAAVPIAWQAIYARTGVSQRLERETHDILAGEMHPMFNPTPTTEDIEAEAQRPLPTPREEAQT